MNRQVSIAFLRDQIGVTNAQLRNKLIDEGIAYDTIADFVEEDIQSLCSSVRRPGGQVTDAQGNQVRDAGIAVPFLVEKRLKVACYAARYYKLIGRPINVTSMTWQLISQFEPFKEMQDEHSDPDDLPPVSKSLPILKWMEVFESYLQNTLLGVSKVPLAYVTRATSEVEDITENPLPDQNPKPFGSKYGSFYEEMIARVSHELPSYDADNQTVMELLVKSFKEYPFFPKEEIQIPLLLKGIISYAPCRRPTSEELNDSYMIILNLTLDSPDWDPHSILYSELESAMVNSEGELREEEGKENHQLMTVNMNNPVLRGVNRCLDGITFSKDIHVVASLGRLELDKSRSDAGRLLFDEYHVNGVSSSQKRGSVTAEELAERWGIGLEAAKRTLGVCTQLVVRVEEPTLKKRFSSNDRMLRYNRISAR